jgi:YVTN family beta-propeller protein
MNILRFSFALLMLMSAISCVAQTTSYKTVNQFPLPGDEKWDYLYSDDQEGKLYVSHGSIVQILDETTGTILGTISGMKGVHGIAIAYGTGKGYISSGKDTIVTSFDTRSFKVLSKIKVIGINPDGIIFDPSSGNIFVFNGKSGNASVINPAKDKVISTIILGGKPEAAVSDGKGHIYINFEEENQICQINTASLMVERTWSIDPGKGPTGLALDNENNRLFSVCSNKLMVVSDAEAGKTVAKVPIGSNPDGAAFDPELKCAYSSNGEGTITVIKEIDKNDFRVIESITTRQGSKTIALNRKTHHLFTSASDLIQPKGPDQKPAVVTGTFRVDDIDPLKK